MVKDEYMDCQIETFKNKRHLIHGDNKYLVGKILINCITSKQI